MATHTDPRRDDIDATHNEHGTCACFPGVCRGGDVVDGRLANGQRCKAAMPARAPGDYGQTLTRSEREFAAYGESRDVRYR